VCLPDIRTARLGFGPEEGDESNTGLEGQLESVSLIARQYQVDPYGLVVISVISRNAAAPIVRSSSRRSA
jgi:hypothetical protein